MTNKGQSAWLITWEGSNAERLGRCKVVAILPPQLGEQNIELLLRTLFCSEYRLTLCEKLFFGTARRNDMPKLFTILHRDVHPAFSYGHCPSDYLYARQVKDLRCEESKENVFTCTLYWTELPKYVPVALDPSAPLPDDPSKITKMVAGEKRRSYTYSSSDSSSAQKKRVANHRVERTATSRLVFDADGKCEH